MMLTALYILYITEVPLYCLHASVNNAFFMLTAFHQLSTCTNLI